MHTHGYVFLVTAPSLCYVEKKKKMLDSLLQPKIDPKRKGKKERGTPTARRQCVSGPRPLILARASSSQRSKRPGRRAGRRVGQHDGDRAVELRLPLRRERHGHGARCVAEYGQHARQHHRAVLTNIFQTSRGIKNRIANILSPAKAFEKLENCPKEGKCGGISSGCESEMAPGGALCRKKVRILPLPLTFPLSL